MGKIGKNYIDPALAELIALRIKQLRDEYGHTQEFLIDKVKLDINRFEICDRMPTLMSLRKICAFYDITLAEFFASIDYPPKPESQSNECRRRTDLDRPSRYYGMPLNEFFGEVEL